MQSSHPTYIKKVILLPEFKGPRGDLFRWRTESTLGDKVVKTDEWNSATTCVIAKWPNAHFHTLVMAILFTESGYGKVEFII